MNAKRETCRMWKPCGDEQGLYTSGPKVDRGQCHKRAPEPGIGAFPITSFAYRDGAFVHWPITHKDDFCGEHTPRDTETST